MIDKKTYNEIGVHIPSILLPKEGIDMQKWSVVACDQYTSEPEYWEEVEKKVGDNLPLCTLFSPRFTLNMECGRENKTYK